LLETPDDFSESTLLSDIIEWDSLSQMSTKKYIEDNFDKSFDIKELIELKTVNDLISLIKEDLD
jgi:acyl carrier protein